MPSSSARIAQNRFVHRVLRKRPLAVRYLIGISAGILGALLSSWIWMSGAETNIVYGVSRLLIVIAALVAGFGPSMFAALITDVWIDFDIDHPGVLFEHEAFVQLCISLLLAAVLSGLISLLRQFLIELDREREQAQMDSSARENVVSIVSHDLRNPLASIELRIELITRLMRSPRPDPLAIDRALQGIRQNTASMNRIIRDLLDSRHIETGTFPLELTESDPHEMIREAVDQVATRAEGKKIAIRVDEKEAPAQVFCDRTRITQAISNLLDNAIKFSPDESRIELRVTSENHELRITVQDQGPGIQEAALPRIFDRYWQARDTASQGTGLGLFIVRGIIQSHGGWIDVTSRQGDGALFRFGIPLKEKPSENRAA